MNVGRTIFVWIAAIAGVIAWVAISAPDATRSRRAAQISRLLNASQLPIEEVDRITLQRAGEPAMIFARSTDGWQQVEPFAYPMDSFSIRQLITQARELEVGETMDPTKLNPGQSLASLQLEPPAVTISYAWKSGSLNLELGRPGAAGWAYLRIGGEPNIRIVKHSLHQRALQMDFKEWRDRTIFANLNPQVTRIERQGGAPAPDNHIVLERARDRWQMKAPAATRADAEAAAEYLDNLLRARSVGFIADQPSDLGHFGLSSPVASLTLTAQSQSLRLLIGSRVGSTTQDYYGMVEGRPVVLRIPAAVLAAFFKPARELVGRTATAVNAADVKAIRIQTSGQEIQLQRQLDRWIAPDSANATVETSAVQELLEQLTSLRASQIEFQDYPRDLELANVTLIGFDGRALDTVRIARQSDQGNWIFDNGDNVLRIHPAAMKVNLVKSDFRIE